MAIGAWLGIAVLLSLAGHGVYLVGLRRHLVEPDRASWPTWTSVWEDPARERSAAWGL